jgi:hypothetical protein
MHKTGNVIIHDDSYIIDECLFDTGAQSNNFVAQAFVNKNAVIFAEFIKPYKSSVNNREVVNGCVSIGTFMILIF